MKIFIAFLILSAKLWLVNRKTLKIFIIYYHGGVILSYLDKIDEYCVQHKISQTQFEKDSGLSKGLISKWRSGAAKPRMTTLEKAADHIGITIDDLMREDAADYYRQKQVPDSWPDTPDAVRDASVKYIPVYRELNPLSADPDPASVEMHYAVMYDSQPDADDCFGYTITDSSMSPYILAGDVVIVRRDNDPAEGDLVLVSSPGEDTVCRKLVRKDDCIILQPFSPHYDAILYRQSELDLLPVFFRGKIVTVIRNIRSSSNSVPEI